MTVQAEFDDKDNLIELIDPVLEAEEEAKWQASFATPESQAWLAKMAAETRLSRDQGLNQEIGDLLSCDDKSRLDDQSKTPYHHD